MLVSARRVCLLSVYFPGSPRLCVLDLPTRVLMLFHHQVLVLSDFTAGGITDADTFIPPLVAVGAVHHHLIGEGVRMKASIVAETAQVIQLAE